MKSTSTDIVVGVTGPGRERAALRFAADRARRDGGEVVLTHVVSYAVTGTRSSILLPLAFEKLAAAATTMLAQVRAEFAELTGGEVPCRTELREGSPPREIVALSQAAQLVVTQRQSEAVLGRVFIGSTANRVAAHADCPLVMVPADWDAERPGGDIVVGVHGDGKAEPPLEWAFREAAASGVPLRVLHAWRLAAAYDGLLSPDDIDRWREGVADRLRTLVSDHRPGEEVEARVEVHHQEPADALLDAAETAALVIVGRHRHHAWLPDQLGSVARIVMREAAAPVMVVPVAKSSGPPEESNG